MGRRSSPKPFAAGLMGLLIIAQAPAAWAADVAAPPATAVAAPSPDDPFERENRRNYAFNEKLDKQIIAPLARIYSRLTPGFIGRGLHNFFVNLTEPVVFINDVLQVRIGRASNTLVRFTLNTTFGIGGLIDVARRADVPHHDNDFGVTLGRYGVKAGPYLYLPVLGPSTARDLVGTGVDFFLDPFHWQPFRVTTTLATTRTVGSGLDTRSVAQVELDALLGNAADPYATLRSTYLQNRQGLIAGQDAPDLNALPSFDDPGAPAASAMPPPRPAQAGAVVVGLADSGDSATSPAAAPIAVAEAAQP
jgi:phospholipid-binding lipoprotein MlaA